MPGHLRYRLPFGACCLLLLHSNLPCGVVRQFLHAFLKRCILYNALHHIIDAVSPSRYLIYLTFVLGFSITARYKGPLSRSYWRRPRRSCFSNSNGTFFGRILHFVELFALVSFKFFSHSPVFVRHSTSLLLSRSFYSPHFFKFARLCFGGIRSFRLRVVSPTVCSPTNRVDSPTSYMSVRLRVRCWSFKLKKLHTVLCFSLSSGGQRP